MSTTILIADDHLPTLHLLARVLTDEGYHVISASDGCEALNMIDGQVPQLVISDIHMPKVDGLVFCQRLRERPETFDVPVLLCSAQVSEGQQQMARSLGVAGILLKPIPIGELLRSVECAIGAEPLQPL